MYMEHRFLLVMAVAALMSSCSQNTECKDSSFGNYTWIDDSNHLNTLRFDDDGNVYSRLPTVNPTTYYIYAQYEFDSDCNGFSLNRNDSTQHYSFTKVEPNSIWFREDASTIDHKYHK